MIGSSLVNFPAGLRLARETRLGLHVRVHAGVHVASRTPIHEMFLGNSVHCVSASHNVPRATRIFLALAVYGDLWLDNKVTATWPARRTVCSIARLLIDTYCSVRSS